MCTMKEGQSVGVTVMGDFSDTGGGRRGRDFLEA